MTNHKCRIASFVFMAFAGLVPAWNAIACRGPAKYKTVISHRDTLDSSGTQLNSIGAAVRQDRANYHLHSKRDPGDEGDDVLFDEGKRAALEQAVDKSPSAIDHGDGLSMYDEVLSGTNVGTIVP